MLPDGTPSIADPRNVLKRALAKCADMGYTFYIHPEIEFFLLKQGWKPGERPEPIDQAGYFDHVPKGMAHDFRRAAIQMLEAIGISVEFSHHEGAPGQNEIDLRYADALTTSDNIMTFRTVVKEVALERDIYATFMPKVFAEHPGSGMHTHMSLFQGDANAFFEAGAPYQLSTVVGSSSPASCGTEPRSPPSPTSGSTPISASGVGGRRPPTSRGDTTTPPPWFASRCTSR
jgi:glutamine synthetase